MSFSNASDHDYKNNTQLLKQRKRLEEKQNESLEEENEEIQVEPLVKSLSPGKKVKNKRNEYLYEYEINPALEFGPLEVNSLRDKKVFRRVNHHDSLRSEVPLTPTKGLIKKEDRLSYSAFSNQSSGRKTVRFAETCEGLLKSVPVDPTFNDSDFIYDMQYRIE